MNTKAETLNKIVVTLSRVDRFLVLINYGTKNQINGNGQTVRHQGAKGESQAGLQNRHSQDGTRPLGQLSSRSHEGSERRWCGNQTRSRYSGVLLTIRRVHRL